MGDQTALLELDVQLSFAEYLRFQYYDSLRRLWWTVPIFAFGAIVSLVLLGVSAYYQDSYLLRDIIPFSSILFLGGIFLFFGPYLSSKREFEINPALRQSIHYTLTESGLATASPRRQGKLPWSKVQEARETKSSFFLYTGGSFAFILPKRSFPGEAEQMAFRELMIVILGIPKCNFKLNRIAEWF